MTALPTSLRRGLVMLLVAMSVIVMFFYWNQTSLKPISQLNAVMEKIIKTSPPEKTWTYRCVSNRCVREHFVNDNLFSRQKRTPFLTCTMTCGVMPSIWPNPTGKLIGSSNSLTFQAHNVRLKISTKFNDVEKLLEDAFDIFLSDIKGMESGNTLDVEKKYGASDGNSERNSEDNDQVTHRNRDCDIQNVDVNVAVTHSDVTFVHLDMDESYNLTIKSKSKVVSGCVGDIFELKKKQFLVCLKMTMH